MLVNTFSEKNKKYSRDRARKDLDNAIRLYGMNFKKHKDAERHLYVEKLRLIQKKLEKAKKWKELALYMGLELKACAYDNHDEQFEPMPIPDIILQPGNPKDDQLPPTDMRSLGRVLKRDKEIFTMGMQRLVEYIDAEDIEGTEIQE